MSIFLYTSLKLHSMFSLSIWRGEIDLRDLILLELFLTGEHELETSCWSGEIVCFLLSWYGEQSSLASW